jgi:hypothetical protein
MSHQSLPECNLDKCGDKGAPVATFVANVFITLYYAVLDDQRSLCKIGFAIFFNEDDRNMCFSTDWVAA